MDKDHWEELSFLDHYVGDMWNPKYSFTANSK